MVQALLQTEVRQIVGTGLVAQVDGKLLVLLDEGVAIVGAKDVMAVLDLFQNRVQFALQLPGNSLSEDLGDLVGGHAPQAHFATALEDPVNGKVALEDEVTAVFDLTYSIETVQVHLQAQLSHSQDLRAQLRN